MKIGQTPEVPLAGSPTAPKKAAQDAQAAPVNMAKQAARAPTAGASVSVSSLARTLEADSGVRGDFDQAKVDEIRAQIDAGTYKVNPEAIADKLLSNASEMLKVTRNDAG